MSSRQRFPGARLDYQDRFALPNQRGGATKEALAAELALVEVAPPLVDATLVDDSTGAAPIG